MDILKDLKSKLEVAADELGGTEIEKKVKKATSLENWPASNSQLHELSSATNDYAAYKEIMPLLWKRLGEPPKNWRTIMKCLTLLEHLIRFGSHKVVEESRDRVFVIRQLQDFFYREDDKDRGSGIREKAKFICDLLADNKQLEEVRKQAAQNLHKFVGVSNNGSVNALGSSGSRYGGGGYGDSGFGGGSGAFGSSEERSSYDSYDKPKPKDEEENGGEKKKKKKKKDHEEDDTSKDPYEEAVAESAAAGEKKKKKKKDKEEDKNDSDEDKATDESKEEKKAKKEKKKLKMKTKEASAGTSSAPVAVPPPVAAPPAASDDGFGDFNSFASASNQTTNNNTLSFDTIATSSRPTATAASFSQGGGHSNGGGDLIDIFASASINNASTSNSSQNWAAQSGGQLDFLSSAPALPQKVATPSLFDAPSTRTNTQQQQQPAKSPVMAVNEHNNADAFSSFVAGHKPTAPTTSSSTATAPAAKKGDAWNNGLINLDGMASSKPTTGAMAPAPFISGSSVDPFSHISGQQQQQARMQQQRGGSMSGMNPMMMQQPQMGGMGMNMGMGQMGGMGGMGMNPQMGMGMGMGMGGGMNQMNMGMGGMGQMGGGMGMGMGGMNQMGGMGMGGGFNQSLQFPAKQADPNKVFF